MDYIKEYGVTDLDYEYIMNNINPGIVECMNLSELAIREVLEYYNSIGITNNIAKLIVSRPDLVIISLPSLKSLLKNIDLNILKNVIDKSIEDLILLGI